MPDEDIDYGYEGNSSDQPTSDYAHSDSYQSFDNETPDYSDWKDDKWYIGSEVGNDREWRDAEAKAFSLRAIQNDLQNIAFDWNRIRGAISDDYLSNMEQRRVQMMQDAKNIGDKNQAYFQNTSDLNTASARSHIGGYRGLSTAIDNLKAKWYSLYDPSFEYYSQLGVGAAPDWDSYKPSMSIDGITSSDTYGMNMDNIASAAIDSDTDAENSTESTY